MRAIGVPLVALFLGLAPAAAQARPDGWVPSWTTAHYGLEQEAILPQGRLADTTLRQTVRLSIGGGRLRIVLSNADGDGPLVIDAVHVAVAGPRGSARILPGTDRELRFGARAGITIPAGKTAMSDPIIMRVPPLARLSVSMHLVAVPAQPTGHLRSLSDSWIAAGNLVAATTLSGAGAINHWYYLAAVQVEAPGAQVVVAMGDSITDGSLSTPNADRRWPDRLAERLAALPGSTRWAVANKGIAGNRLLAYGRGPSALDRFDADVLAVPHVRTVFLAEGVNDLGQFAKTTQDPAAHAAMVDRITAGYARLVARAHAHGLRIVAATIMPDGDSGYQPSALDEQDRQKINAWIRTPGHFDGIVDWDALMRDPHDAGRLNPIYDSGDHIHPAKGYRTMGDAIPLDLLTR